MIPTRSYIARGCYGLAAIIFLAETLFGCVAVLGIGFDSMQDILLDLSLTMAFPIFLVSFLNKTVALVGLWIFFLAQWIDMCLISRPPTLLNPFDGFHGSALVVGIILFSIAFIVRRKILISGV
jgi:hypothetical protein